MVAFATAECNRKMLLSSIPQLVAITEGVLSVYLLLLACSSGFFFRCMFVYLVNSVSTRDQFKKR